MNITRRHNQKRRRNAQKRAAEETTRRLRAVYGREQPVLVSLSPDGGWAFVRGAR